MNPAPSSTRSGLSTAVVPAERYGLVGQSRAMDEMIRRIELVSETRSTVLITGETGTGKELVARAIHERSAERHLPFVRVNCAAIPETLLESELFGHVKGAFTDAVATKRGKFALAHRGTIFLDEIGATTPALQVRLLRVLQEREIEPLGGERTERVDVRVIAATNRDLRQLVDDGRFQEDLFYRLHVIPIVAPPLRDRLEDIPQLVEHFIDKHSRKAGRPAPRLDGGVMAMLQTLDWPGNIRQLEHTIERAIVLTRGPIVTREALSIDAAVTRGPVAVTSLDLHQNIERVERETIRRALDLSAQKQQAARLLGISSRALSYYLSKYPFIESRRPGAVAARRPLEVAL